MFDLSLNPTATAGTDFKRVSRDLNFPREAKLVSCTGKGLMFFEATSACASIAMGEMFALSASRATELYQIAQPTSSSERLVIR